jgi:CheY-like chemotaxis protein
LVVDDEPFNIMALEGLFEQLGIRKVDKAFNGKAGLAKILSNNAGDKCNSDKHFPYKLIITDKNMPIMNGI